jgi:hypothetical protein
VITGLNCLTRGCGEVRNIGRSQWFFEILELIHESVLERRLSGVGGQIECAGVDVKEHLHSLRVCDGVHADNDRQRGCDNGDAVHFRSLALKNIIYHEKLDPRVQPINDQSQL